MVSTSVPGPDVDFDMYAAQQNAPHPFSNALANSARNTFPAQQMMAQAAAAQQSTARMAEMMARRDAEMKEGSGHSPLEMALAAKVREFLATNRNVTVQVLIGEDRRFAAVCLGWSEGGSQLAGIAVAQSVPDLASEASAAIWAAAVASELVKTCPSVKVHHE